jgi:hypothetical protein
LETPNNHILWDFDVTTDGKLLCMFLDLDNFSVLFARYTADGKKDATFSKAILPGDFHIYTRMERSGEDYFVSGMKIDPISFAFTNVVAKVSNQGVPVANFGKSSIATALQPQGSDDIELITNLYPATDGSVFLTGYTEQADSAVIWVEKITKAGIFDPTFALSGRHKVNNNIVDENSLIISDLVVLSNGKLVLLNLGEDLDKEVLFTKLTLLDEKGKVEKQFGEDGTLILEEKPSNSTIPTLFTNIETNTKGQIVGCGLSINNNEFFEAPIARFTPVYSVDAKDEIAKIESVAVFPNPTIDVLNLAYELKEDASVSIQLFDSQGKNVQLLSSIQSKNAGKHTEQFNLNKNIPAGLYLLKIDLGKEGTKTLKINKI